MSLILDEHREYLADANRLEAFAEAIAALVRPGDVVLDLGSGTGILGLMACRAGARRVYALDYGPIVALAREVARANGMADRVCCIKELSTRATLPEAADLVITDQIGRFGFEAGLMSYLPDARRRLLKPGGRLMPASVDLWIAPVEHPDQRDRVAFWNSRPAGFDFSPARPIAAGTGYPLALDAPHLLGAGARIATLDPGSDDTATIGGSADIEVGRSGTLHGIGGWFVAHLADAITITNAPGHARRIGRRNVFFPIDRPIDVAPADRVRMSVRIRPADLLVSWSVRVEDAGGLEKGSCRQSTFQGMLLPEEDRRRTGPAFVPVLSPFGEARRSVLELCDGRRALGTIEAEVFHRHRDLFERPEQAAAFVAEVVTRYAR